MKKRAIYLGKWALLTVCVGLCYDVWVRATGWGVPCLFHELTGLDCPGCGVSRMCMALLRLDVPGAFRYNPAILCLLPLWCAVFGVQAIRYIRTGNRNFSGWQNVVLYFSIAVLLVFGVVRNLI